MTSALAHRVPDHSGARVDRAARIALSHRRRALIQFSPTGHQRMQWVSGRYVIVFNGEVYNHRAIRVGLERLMRSVVLDSSARASGEDAPEPWLWRYHSDTETLLAAVECWGVQATLQRCGGMFSIAPWNRKTRALTLAHDCCGEKLLYSGWVGRGDDRAFVFGSELKTLKANPGFSEPVCLQALVQYLVFVYVPAPRSILEGRYKLAAGWPLTSQGQPRVGAPAQPFRPGQAHVGVTVKRWWSLASAVESGASNPLTNESEALRLLEEQLIEAVSLQSLADVPLGAILSGGVESSTIVALILRQSTRPVKIFTIGFGEAGYGQSPHSRAVSRHLRTVTDLRPAVSASRTKLRVPHPSALDSTSRSAQPTAPNWDRPFH